MPTTPMSETKTVVCSECEQERPVDRTWLVVVHGVARYVCSDLYFCGSGLPRKREEDESG